MAYALTAPVGDKKRTTKPEPGKKPKKYAAVANKAADVELVQVMLVANGYKVPVDGKCNGGLIKTIRQFQKAKAGFKTPDGIIDPGEKSWKAGLPALKGYMKSVEKVQLYEIKEGGKTKYVPKAEFEAKQAKLLNIVWTKGNGMYGMAEFWWETLQEADEMLQGSDGLLMAMTEFSVRIVNKKAEPPYTPILNARSEAGFLRALAKAKKPDWNKIVSQETKAVKAYNKAAKAFNAYLDAKIGTAGKMMKAAETTSDISFAIVETYATGYLVVTKGMPPAKAHAVASAGTAGIKSASMQAGNYLIGKKVDFGQVAVDTAFGFAKGLAGGKIGSAFASGAASKLGAKFASKFSSRIGKKGAEFFFQKFLATGYGQGMVENAAKEAIGLFQTSIQKGRAPTKKEFEDAVIKILTGSIMNSPASKSLTAWDVKVPAKTKDFLVNNLTPKTLEGVKKGLAKDYGKQLVNDTTSKIYKELVDGVVRTTGNKAVEVGSLYAVDRLSGQQSEAQLQKLTEEGIKRDTKMRLEVQVILKARLVKELEAQKATQ